MTDTPVAPVQTVEPTITSTPAPVVDNSSTAQAPVVPAVEAAAPIAEAPTAPEKPAEAAPAAPETLLGKTPEPAPTAVSEPVVEQKTEPVADATKTNTEGGQTEQAPPPSYDPWTLPEGVTLEAERVGEFTKILSDLETNGKVAHDLVQQFGQKAVDFHIAEVTRVADQMVKTAQENWRKQVSDWQKAVISDPDIGGNRLDATVEAAQNFINTHGGTPEQQKAIRELMESSGLGNHPVLVRLFASAGRAMKEGVPLAAAKPPAVNKSKVKTMYG